MELKTFLGNGFHTSKKCLVFEIPKQVIREPYHNKGIFWKSTNQLWNWGYKYL